MNNIQLGLAFGLSAMVFDGISSSLTKVPSKELGANKTIFYRNIFNTIFLSVIFLATLSQSSFPLKYIFFAIALSVVGYLPMYFFYRAMALGKIGVIKPITSSSQIITIILAIVFLNERLSWISMSAMSLIILGIILLSIKIRDWKASDLFKVESGLPYALLAAFGWGIWSVLAKIPAEHLGPFLTALIIEAFAIPVAYFMVKREKVNLKIENKKILYYIVPLSAAMVLWSLCYYQGIKISSVSIVSTLSSASPLVVILAGYSFYKEKLSAKQWLAISLILIGIVLLSR